MHPQFRNPAHTYTRIEDAGSRVHRLGGPKVSPQRDQTLTPVPEEQGDEWDSVDGHSLNYGEDAASVRGAYGQLNARGGPSRPTRFEPLPAIDSGEPFAWDTYHAQNNEDPFMDTYSPSSDSYDNDDDHRDDYAAYDHQKPGIRDLSRPISSYQTSTTVPSNSTGFTQTSEYQQRTPPPAVDHFRYDIEAYASGRHSRRFSAFAQSRSPTPAVDDEDYYVDGDSSVHYTGDSPSPVSHRRSRVEDPEKSELGSRDIGAEGTSETLRYAAMEWKAMISEKMSTVSSRGRDADSEIPAYAEPPDSPETTRHFGPAPVGRVHRRLRLKKRVQLTNGNLVVDLAVPPKMVLPRKGEPEMMKTRYTAVTCDPDEFEKRGFFLRQNEYGRSTEVFVVVTMYNVGSSLSYLLAPP